MQNNLLEVFKIPTVPTTRHYWIVRTNSGLYFDDFIFRQYIAIAWDFITLNILNNCDEDSIKRIIGLYDEDAADLDDEETTGPDKAKLTATYNKLHRFVFEIAKGDIVLIPSANSDLIAIAEVVGDTYENPNYVEMYLQKYPDSEIVPCPYHKRRNVKILKTISKGSMDIYLAKGFNSQHAISNMDDYASFIDRTIYGVYAKGNDIHTTLHAGHPNGLSLKELVELSTCLEAAANSLAEQCGLDFDSSKIDVKLNIHSPGLIEFIGAAAASGVVVSLLIFTVNNLINGGKLDISFKTDEKHGSIDFNVSSENLGIRGHEREDKKLELKEKAQLLKLVDQLDIKTPDIVSAILNGEKITSDMVSEAQNQQASSTESE